MRICSCMPSEQPLSSQDVVKHVAEGASTMKEVIARSGAGTNCGCCAPSLAKAKSAVIELARERDQAAGRAGVAWPTRDEMVRGDDVVRKAVLR